ncbi:MAG: hypothetical protein CM1200mP27_12850 [Chloroflexota bacterium]|nr:MAG: hypothetical protein CM1200mP27_12850 [Chloroflexota bacterium]
MRRRYCSQPNPCHRRFTEVSAKAIQVTGGRSVRKTLPWESIFRDIRTSTSCPQLGRCLEMIGRAEFGLDTPLTGSLKTLSDTRRIPLPERALEGVKVLTSPTTYPVHTDQTAGPISG